MEKNVTGVSKVEEAPLGKKDFFPKQFFYVESGKVALEPGWPLSDRLIWALMREFWPNWAKLQRNQDSFLRVHYEISQHVRHFQHKKTQ